MAKFIIFPIKEPIMIGFVNNKATILGQSPKGIVTRIKML
jgi:hypothetical protein